MDRDLSLKSQEVKLILLICGDSGTGKKTIVKGMINGKQNTKKEHASFKSYFFNHEETIGKSTISIPIELRILNSEEMETELKLNKAFYSEALGAFVVNSITDNNSFVNGEKWKDKIDLMCCLPNRFPLPIFLLINKCDPNHLQEEKEEKDKENNNNSQYMQKDKIESYSLENQFFSTFFIGKISENNNIINTEKIEDNKINNDEKNNKNLIDSPYNAFK